MTAENLRLILNVSCSLDKGGRDYMEDVLFSHFEKDNDKVIFGIFGIFDGHGGVEAANFVKNNLKNELIKIDKFWSNDDNDVLESIKFVYSKIQKLIWIDRENWPRTITGHKSTSGTTATILIIRNGILYTGHVGDSGILLAYLNENEVLTCRELTKEHKPDDPVERKRIEKSGGSLKYNGGAVRVNWHRGNLCDIKDKSVIPFLAVARSLGDLWSYDTQTHQYHVSPEPDVTCIHLNFDTHKAVIIGSDGLWNVINGETCIKLLSLCDYLNNTGYSLNPAQLIINYCLFLCRKKNSKSDNVSVIVVLLKRDLSPLTSINEDHSLSFKVMNKEFRELFNELQNNNLFGGPAKQCFSEKSELILDNCRDLSRLFIDRFSTDTATKRAGASIEMENMDLLKEYMKTNKRLVSFSKSWRHDEDYWRILLKSLEKSGHSSFPNIVLHLDSLSDEYLESLLVGFPWSVCCLELLDRFVMSNKIKNYIRLQPLLTDFWVSFYRTIIMKSDNSLLTMVLFDNSMRNILISKSEQLNSWVGSLLNLPNNLSYFSMRKSVTITNYSTALKDFFGKENNSIMKRAAGGGKGGGTGEPNENNYIGNYFKLKRSASFDNSKSQLYSNYQTTFQPFLSDTPTLSPTSLKSSNCSSDFLQSQMIPADPLPVPYSLKRQFNSNYSDLLFVPNSQLSRDNNNHKETLISQYSLSKKRRFIL